MAVLLAKEVDVDSIRKDKTGTTLVQNCQVVVMKRGGGPTVAADTRRPQSPDIGDHPLPGHVTIVEGGIQMTKIVTEVEEATMALPAHIHQDLTDQDIWSTVITADQGIT